MEDDDLPLLEVGEWTREKHERLCKYVDIAKSVRKQFTDRAGATYIDLFSGPGRCRVRETGEVIDGSPVAAVKKSITGGTPFSAVYLSDADALFANAATKRVAALGLQPTTFVGAAEQAVQQVASKLDKFALHFAFLDPYNLDDLSFSILTPPPFASYPANRCSGR